jgi:hypothetical protein
VIGNSAGHGGSINHTPRGNYYRESNRGATTAIGGIIGAVVGGAIASNNC